MRVTFWGTRGSIAKPGPATVRYGGNTSCVEVRSAADTLVVLDCGTGAHALGQALLRPGAARVRGHLLLSHTHWDHIQGIPFFAPLFVPGNEWDIYAPRGLGRSLRDTLAGQMQYAYFPVTLEQLGATIRYHDLVEGALQVGDIQVTTRYVNHPALALAYRLEADGVSVVYATDHEPHSRQLATDPTAQIGGEDRKHTDFLTGADLLVHDTQYTAAEYPAKVSWGHSTVEYVVAIARAAGVRRLALFHHDPLRDDWGVDGLVEEARRLAAGALEVFGAAEGQVVDLGRATPRPGRPEEAAASPARRTPAALSEHSVLIAAGDPGIAVPLSEAVRADGVRLLLATDGDQALELARLERPSLVIVERDLPGRDAFSLCQAMEPASAPDDEPPVVVVTEKEDPAERRAGAQAGVTDWLVQPFSSQYARSRIRAWLLRTACRWQPAAPPPDEATRLTALHRLNVLDTKTEERFDRLTRAAAALFDVPIVLVSLVDRDRQWFKSRHGLDTPETSRETSFCAHAILEDDALIVPDAQLDPRFADNPMVTEGPRVRFYAGHPLTVAGGRRVGTLCLVDVRPREFDERAVRALRELAGLVEVELQRPR